MSTGPGSVQRDDEVPGRLAECRAPYLIGVRHHSAALARVMPRLLASFAPEALLVEMPPEFQPWLEHMGKPDLEAPVALAACDDSRLISFYPLADFSPELVAIRWAAQHGVPVIFCDLSLAASSRLEGRGGDVDRPPDGPTALEHLLQRHAARDSGELWEKLVETPACQASPEAIRRAALTFGWMVRHSSHGPSPLDRQREGAMRDAVAGAAKRSAAVVGSFHAAALLSEPVLWSAPDPIATAAAAAAAKLATSLVPYSFAQLDQRSGYPAGVMDPAWQQTMLAAADSETAGQLAADLAVALCRRLRAGGHVAGTPDATEIVRMARDLGRLRGNAAPGRGELLEAIETCLVQGDLLGRGRAVASAAQAVLVGTRRGRLPDGLPRSGLAPQVESAVARLKLPGPNSSADEAVELRLDPLRSRLDRARAVLFRRLDLAGVRYAERVDTEALGPRENLTEVWRVQWTGATTATVEAAGLHGVTLAQVCEAAVRRLRQPEAASADDDQPEHQHPATTLVRLSAAAECGLGGPVQTLLAQLDGPFLRAASAAQLIAAAALLQRIAIGHILGLPLGADEAAPPDVEQFDASPDLLDDLPLLEAALRGLDGLRGSEEPADIAALVDLTALIRGDLRGSAHGNGPSPLLPALRSHLARLQRDGSPRMQGAAWGALAMLAQVEADRLGAALASWYDGASTGEGRAHLRSRLQGLMVPLLPLASSDPAWLGGLEERLAASPDQEFLARLPALRGGFDVLTPADRARLLADRLARLAPGGPAAAGARRIDDPVALASATAADRAGRAAIARLMPEFSLREPGKSDPHLPWVPISEPPGELTLAERWRLVLGVQGGTSAKARRAASALDQLYGASAREGRGHRNDLAGGGGTEAASPSVREWINDVDGLFGKDVCEEVLGEAAAGGRAAVLEHLDPNTVRPSVALLEQILSLRGALPERELESLRKLARRITERLAKQLEDRLRPALSGLSTARPTRRRSRRLDFGRTLSANLNTAYRRDDGRIGLAPRRLVFRTPARRQMDWHLIFVVDVSGSMEASVIYSALVSAVFSALPAIDVRFFAFSTEVIDMSGAVDDPLALLMEVQVGGGTHIGLGLRAAREAIKNPSRTLVVLVTDFEEGVSVPEMLAEIRMLADSGAKLLGLAALDDDARPRYHAGNAATVVSAGMPVAAVSPERLAEWVGDQIRKGPS